VFTEISSLAITANPGFHIYPIVHHLDLSTRRSRTETRTVPLSARNSPIRCDQRFASAISPTNPDRTATEQKETSFNAVSPTGAKARGNGDDGVSQRRRDSFHLTPPPHPKRPLGEHFVAPELDIECLASSATASARRARIFILPLEADAGAEIRPLRPLLTRRPSNS